MSKSRGRLLAILGAIAVLWGALQAATYVWRLGHPPEALKVWQILYAKEKAWAFGPGGNETALVIYRLPRAAAEGIASGGTAFLDAADARYRWRATPIAAADDWLLRDGVNDPRPPGYRPGVEDFMDQYGFGLSLPAKVETLAHEALWGPDSYYAYGRGSLIIVAPKAGRVIFAYAG